MPLLNIPKLDSLVMYARRKIDSGSDMFSTGCLDGGFPFPPLQIGSRQYGVPDRAEYSDTVLRYVVCVYVLILEVRRGSSLSISICAFSGHASTTFTEPKPI
jgi:hypothetical protein